MNNISNEIIIASLLQSGTIKDAAAKAGISVRAMHDRMKNEDFRVEYAEAKNDIIRTAVTAMSNKLSGAVDTVADIMEDKNINPAVRLQAAQTIINNATKFMERLNNDEASAGEIDRKWYDDFDAI